eukprot:Sdes_comp19340_c0_seq1m10548
MWEDAEYGTADIHRKFKRSHRNGQLQKPIQSRNQCNVVEEAANLLRDNLQGTYAETPHDSRRENVDFYYESKFEEFFTEERIETEIKKYPSHRSGGPDEVNPFLVKKIDEIQRNKNSCKKLIPNCIRYKYSPSAVDGVQNTCGSKGSRKSMG